MELDVIKQQYPAFTGKNGHNFVDRSGQTQGYLHILYRYYQNVCGHSAFVCECECGNVVVLESSALRKGQQSCGCKAALLRKQQLVDDLSGKQFGDWTAICLDDGRGGYYICQCTCGTRKSVARSSLLRGLSKSCGCKTQQLFAEQIALDLPIGSVYNKLTVIGSRFKKDGVDTHYYYPCRCECGNIINVRATILKNNSIMSCGCAKSKGELFIKNLLLSKNVHFMQEYKIPELRGDVYPLRFDFAIFKNEQLQCVIEYNGEQHYKERGGYFSGKLDKIQDYDNRKQTYCAQNNIKLITIPYYFSQEQIKQEIINALD